MRQIWPTPREESLNDTLGRIAWAAVGSIQRLLVFKATVLVGWALLLTAPLCEVVAAPYDSIPSGYIADVRAERLISMRPRTALPPEPPAETRLMDRLYPDDLDREFRKAYRQKFGYTESEQWIRDQGLFARGGGHGEVAGGKTYEELLEERKTFGEFMVRRVTEHQVDDYARNKPELKKVLEVKERLSRAEVQMRPGYALKANYRLSVNRMDVEFENPFVDAEWQWFVGGGNPYGMPAGILSIGYDINPRVRVSTYFKSREKELAVVGTRKLPHGITTSLTALTRERRDDVREEDPLALLGDSRVLAGVALEL